jgi:hypothetical protein
MLWNLRFTGESHNGVTMNNRNNSTMQTGNMSDATWRKWADFAACGSVCAGPDSIVSGTRRVPFAGRHTECAGYDFFAGCLMEIRAAGKIPPHLAEPTAKGQTIVPDM